MYKLFSRFSTGKKVIKLLDQPRELEKTRDNLSSESAPPPALQNPQKTLQREFHQAVMAGDLGKVEEIYEDSCTTGQQAALLASLSSGQNTPMHLAAQQGHLTILQFLLSKGASANLKNAEAETAIMLALTPQNAQTKVSQGQKYCFDLLWSQPSLPLVPTQGGKGFNLLFLAAYHNLSDLFEKMLSDPHRSAMVKLMSKQQEKSTGQNLLMFLVNYERLELLKIFLSSQDQGSLTALFEQTDSKGSKVQDYLEMPGRNEGIKELVDDARKRSESPSASI